MKHKDALTCRRSWPLQRMSRALVGWKDRVGSRERQELSKRELRSWRIFARRLDFILCAGVWVGWGG